MNASIQKIYSIVAFMVAVFWVASGTVAANAEPLTGSEGSVRPESVSRWLSVDVGTFHVCGLATDHSIWCWGGGDSCELGDGLCHSEGKPVMVGTRTDWQVLMTGHDDTCAIPTDGSLWCWGFNGRGQLGDGTTTNIQVPTQIGTATDWVTVDGSLGGKHYDTDSHTCGIRADASLWCWGDNREGQVGDGTTEPRHTPTQIGASQSWAQVSAGNAKTCAIRSDGTLWCWGRGYLGNGDLEQYLVPTQIGKRDVWASVSAGDDGICAITDTAHLWCWGGNVYGDVGIGQTDVVPTPARVGHGKTWSAVHAGSYTVCGVKAAAGSGFCWGLGTSGQLGSPNDDVLRPTRIQGGPSSWQPSIVTTYQTGCGLGTDQTLWCWGSGRFGQLANGQKHGTSVKPVQVIAG